MSTLMAALLYVLAHWSEILSAFGLLCTAVAAAGRAIPADRWAALETSHPRVAQAFRFCRAVGVDLVKAGRAAWAVLGPVLRPLLERRGVKLPPDGGSESR